MHARLALITIYDPNPEYNADLTCSEIRTKLPLERLVDEKDHGRARSCSCDRQTASGVQTGKASRSPDSTAHLQEPSGLAPSSAHFGLGLNGRLDAVGWEQYDIVHHACARSREHEFPRAQVLLCVDSGWVGRLVPGDEGLGDNFERSEPCT